MTKNYLFFLITKNYLFFLSFSQNLEKKSDSLKNILKTNVISYEQRIEVSHILTKYLGECHFKQVKFVNDKIYTLSKSNNYKKEMGPYFQNCADYKPPRHRDAACRSDARLGLPARPP